jgi:cytochrome c556
MFSKGSLTTRHVAAVAAVVLAGLSQFAIAQQQTPNAALQARARMMKQHKQTGSMGNGYRPWSAWTYQRSARRNAEALSTYGQNVQQIPPATAKEHLDEIRKNLAATKSEIAKLGDEAAQEADVKHDVGVLTKHLTECEQLCASIEKAIGEGEVDTEKVCAHCSGLEDKLKAAEAEHRALLKKLGLEPPKSAADHAEHQPKKTNGAPAKKDQ